MRGFIPRQELKMTMPATRAIEKLELSETVDWRVIICDLDKWTHSDMLYLSSSPLSSPLLIDANVDPPTINIARAV